MRSPLGRLRFAVYSRRMRTLAPLLFALWFAQALPAAAEPRAASPNRAIDPDAAAAGMVHPFADSSAQKCEVLGLGGSCVYAAAGPLFVTDLFLAGDCPGRAFALAGQPGTRARWALTLSPQTPAVTGAHILVRSGEALFLGLEAAARSTGATRQCAVTWSGFYPDGGAGAAGPADPLAIDEDMLRSPAPPVGKLRINARPRTSLQVDGRDTEGTGWWVPLRKSGTMVIGADGAPWTVRVSYVVSDNVATFSMSTEPWAILYVNNVSRGKTPTTGIVVGEDPVRVHLRKPGDEEEMVMIMKFEAGE